MSSAKTTGISPAVRSGQKFRTGDGISAIKDGQKSRPDMVQIADAPVPGAEGTGRRKPAWLRVTVPGGEGYRQVKGIVRDNRLATVCEESHCPNIAECWANGTATIMVLGSVCTRACRFCSVDTGNPKGWLDPEEPEHTGRSVALMGLKYVVITSVDRDDLPDFGAGHYAACVREIKRQNPSTAVEALTPDFDGVEAHVATVVDSGLHVFAQNIETVDRLTREVRDPRAGYRKTIDVLAFAKAHRPALLTKTSLLMGLGETDSEVQQCMDDLRSAGVDILTLGQYLRPTKNHLPVRRWVTPDDFEQYRLWGLERGFMEVASGPLVRSSYRADRILEGNNLGLPAAKPAAKPAVKAAGNHIPITMV